MDAYFLFALIFLGIAAAIVIYSAIDDARNGRNK